MGGEWKQRPKSSFSYLRWRMLEGSRWQGRRRGCGCRFIHPRHFPIIVPNHIYSVLLPFSFPSSPSHFFIGYPLDLAIGCLDLLYDYPCEHACLPNSSILLSKPGSFFLPLPKPNPVLKTELALSDLKSYLRVIHKDHISNCNHMAMTFNIPLSPHSIYIDKDITEHCIEQCFSIFLMLQPFI